MPSLTSIADARAQALAHVAPLPAEEVGLADAHGRVLAEPVRSADPVPGFDNSAMDGYALRAADLTDGGSAPALAIVGESRAGHPFEGRVEPGCAVRISTGAMLPEGADAVVRVEDTAEEDGWVLVHAPAEAGADIRRAGEDVQAGELVLTPGTRLGAAEIGVLASVGRGRVRCARRPRVSVLSTGDELRDPDEPMPPGGVRDSNSHTVAALAREAGSAIAGVRRARDDPAETRAALEASLRADVTVICGGVSVGPHDHVRPALADLGVEEVLWGIALRPGKPTWFGLAPGGTPVFGLPGNPVSAMVTFALFVRPALLAMTGLAPEGKRTRAILDAGYRKSAGRAHAVRCGLRLGHDGWHAEPTKDQGSHVLTSMLGADALALIEADRERVEPGERVEVELLGPVASAT